MISNPVHRVVDWCYGRDKSRGSDNLVRIIGNSHHIRETTIFSGSKYRRCTNLQGIARGHREHPDNFLAPEDFPAKLEMDSYDNHAIHVGGINKEGVLVGTLRLVLPSARGFPLFEHCELFPEYQCLADPDRLAQLTAAEISRLAISRSYRRRRHDGLYDLASKEDCMTCARTEEEAAHHRHKPEIVLGLYKTLYQASKRQGITHWFAAMEKPLLRLLRRYNFDFKAIGPELDYYGPVTPYFAEISEIEAGVHRHCPDMLAEFVRGLEPELVPAIARE